MNNHTRQIVNKALSFAYRPCYESLEDFATLPDIDVLALEQSVYVAACLSNDGASGTE